MTKSPDGSQLAQAGGFVLVGLGILNVAFAEINHFPLVNYLPVGVVFVVVGVIAILAGRSSRATIPIQDSQIGIVIGAAIVGAVLLILSMVDALIAASVYGLDGAVSSLLFPWGVVGLALISYAVVQVSRSRSSPPNAIDRITT